MANEVPEQKKVEVPETHGNVTPDQFDQMDGQDAIAAVDAQNTEVTRLQADAGAKEVRVGGVLQVKFENGRAVPLTQAEYEEMQRQQAEAAAWKAPEPTYLDQLIAYVKDFYKLSPEEEAAAKAEAEARRVAEEKAAAQSEALRRGISGLASGEIPRALDTEE